MEKLYRKKENGRYEEIGYGFDTEIKDGIWMVQSKPYSRSITNMVWLVGDIKRPADIITHASLQTLRDDLTKYLMEMLDGESEDFKEAKKLLGGYLKSNDGININNISMHDLSMLLLRKISNLIEEK